MRYRLNPYVQSQPEMPSPFRRDNRKPDGMWDAPDATDDKIRGTSVDPYDPIWPRWKQTPPPGAEGDFISDQPFFDIDEVTQTAKLYPPGTPLADRNVDGNPASRQRVSDILTGNLWRRRLLVGHSMAEAPLRDLAQDVGSQTQPGPAANAPMRWGTTARQLPCCTMKQAPTLRRPDGR